MVLTEENHLMHMETYIACCFTFYIFWGKFAQPASFTPSVGTVGQLSLSTLNVFTTLVKYDMGDNIKMEIFLPTFSFANLALCLLFTHAPESRTILLFLLVSLQIAIRAGCVCPCRTWAGEPTCLSCVSHLLSQRIPDLQM